jgi:hypothetical protein
MPVHPLLIVGVVLLLLGWLAIPLAVTLSGGFVGLMGGVLLIDFVSVNFPSQQIPDWAYPVAAAVLALLGALVAKKIFYWLIFVGGVFAVLALKAQLDSIYGLSEQLANGPVGSFAATPWFTLVVGLAGGALLSLLRKYLLIVLSALTGAVLVARYGGLEDKMVILALVGLGFQTLCVTLKPRKLIFGGGGD